MVRALAACSLGGAGHLNPLLPFLDAARRRGDEVLVVGPPALRAIVEGAGYAFESGGEPPEAEVAAIRERLPVAPAAEASVLGNRELFGRLATRAMLPAMEDAFTAWAPDLVLREPCEYASAVLAERTQTPVAQVAISLADVEEGAIATAAPVLEEHELGLVAALMATPYLSHFPASLDPSPFPTTLRFREGATSAASPLPDWWEGREGPLLYLTFGTVLGYMSYATSVYQAALAAVGGLDGRVLLTVGQKFDISSLGSVPDNVHIEAWVDQDRAFADADVVVCHGGSGTVLGALGAGVPLVLVPFFADQFENSRRIAAVGAGSVVERPDRGSGSTSLLTDDDAGRVTEAIDIVLTDASYKREARQVAEEMRGVPAVADVLARLVSSG